MFHLQFRTKILLTIFSLLIVLSGLALASYLAILRVEYLEKRTSLAQDVLANYIGVSNYSYKKINALGQIADSGRLINEPARQENENRLIETLARVRKGIELEISYADDEPEHEEIYHFAEIERIAYYIIDTGKKIRKAIEKEDVKLAQDLLIQLRRDEILGRFNELLDEAIEEEEEEVVHSHNKLLQLVKRIKRSLPVLLVLVLVPTFIIAFISMRRLTSSISNLYESVKAYEEGNLTHVTPLEGDREFSRLSLAFNQMAKELLARRTAMEESQVSLEAEVSERTKELKTLNKRLEDLDRSRRQFLADISHELRTPLTVIQGEAEMALRGNEKSAIEYQQCIERVRQQTVHTTHLVEDLLFVARSEQGKARLVKRVMYISKIIESVCFDFKIIAEKKDIKINIKDHDRQIKVHGDMDRLRQVFTILIDNAIRYSNNGGKIDVLLELMPGNDFVEISIIDEGIGMSQEDLSQAFYRFYRGANAERHSTGSGLGLPVAKAIVEAHEGEISLSSQQDKGVKVVVRFPIETKMRIVA